MNGPLWTAADRRTLGELFDRARPDLAHAESLTRRVVADLAAAFPSGHRSIDLLPLLVHKIAGYNADLFNHVRRLLRADAAAREMLELHPRTHAVFATPDMYLAEHALAAHLRRRGGSFIALHPAVQSGEALERRYAPRCAAPGFEPSEFVLPGPGAASPAPPPRPLSGRGPATLFVASMNNYLQPMTPVMAELLRRGRRVVLLTPRAALTWPAARAVPTGVERLCIEDLLTPRHATAYLDHQRAVLARWNAAQDKVSAALQVEGTDLWPLLRADLGRVVQDYLPACATLIDLAHELAVALPLRSCVVARLRRATEGALAAALRSISVPVTMLVHGHISNFPERTFDTGSFDADRVCVWGPAQKEQVLSAHAPPAPARVEPTGNPAWDGLIRSRPAPPARAALRASLAARLTLDPRRAWIVLTTQDITAPHFPAVVEAFARRPDATLIVKTHPAESPAWYRARCAGLPSAVVPDHGDVDLHDLLAAADATLTFSSTTNLESLILGTPVITYTFAALAAQDRAAYLEECGLPLAASTPELASILHAAADDPPAWRSSWTPAIDRALHTFLAGYPDGDAARRAADAIDATTTAADPRHAMAGAA